MRLFVALDIDEAIREKIGGFMEDLHEFAPDVRWVKTGSLHVTLKFIGERSDVDEIQQALSKIQAQPIKIVFRSYGFFPAQQSPRVFWIGIESEPDLSTLAKTIDETLISTGVAKEMHAYSPHLTLARTGSGRPNRGKEDRANKTFHKLLEKLTAIRPPEFGTMTAREFFLYRSQLGPKGSSYTKIASFAFASIHKL